MNKRLTLITSLCLSLTIATAVNLDSLWGVWNDKSLNDTSRLDALQLLIWDGVLYTDPDSAFILSEFQLEFARKKGLKKYEGIALNNQGLTFKLKGDLYKSFDYLQQSLTIKKELKDQRGVAGQLINIGHIKRIQGDYVTAAQNYMDALRITKKIGDLRFEANANLSMAILYYYDGDLEKAIHYGQEGLSIKKDLGDKVGLGQALITMGGIYIEFKEFDKALQSYKKSINLFKGVNDNIGTAMCINNIGLVYLKQYKNNLIDSKYESQLLDSALFNFKTALDYYEKIGDKKGCGETLYNIGKIHVLTGKYRDAIYFSSKALELCKEVGTPGGIMETAKTLYDIYKKIGPPSKALKMHELYIEMRDSLNSMENKEATIKLGYQHAYETQAAIDSVDHAKVQAIKEEKIKRQRTELESEKKLRNTLFGGLGIISLLLIFAINRFLVTRKQKLTIAGQKEIVEEQKQKVEEQKKDITDSIRYAENIQRALLPTINNLKDALPDGFILFQPKDIVSGDFYWMQHHNNKVYFAACDCTGHGVPGAFMSMIGSSLLDEAVVEKGITQPNEIFFEVRKGFINALKQTGAAGQQKDGMDAVLCSWNRNGTLEYSLAYNPLFLIRKGEILETKADKQPVGFHTGEQKPFTHHEVKLEKGDTIYLFSDGYPDQFGGKKDKKFMMKNFKKLLLSIQDKTMNEQKTILETTMAEWKGETEQVDDILVMGVRF